jgi:putative membrane protein
VLSNPSVELGVILFVGIYVIVARRTGNRFLPYQVWALSAAMAALILTLDGPLDALEDARLFTAHMVQHLMLALVIPPLLLLGTPDWLVRPLLSFNPLRRTIRILVYPVVAYLIYNLVLVGLHSPKLFDLMCYNEDFHILMHLVLLGTAILLWWPLLSPIPELPRLSYPAQMLYLFFWLIPMAAVAAPITMASTIIYPWYQQGPHPLGLSPLSDQVLGGLTMWVGAGFYMIGVFTTIYFHWASREDLDEPEFNLLPPGSAETAVDQNFARDSGTRR